MKKCQVCQQEIPVERLEVFPETETCARHSKASRQIGYMIGTAAKGCAAALMIVPNDAEAQRQAKRAFMRSR
jgi:hypothetical protein